MGEALFVILLTALLESQLFQSRPQRLANSQKPQMATVLKSVDTVDGGVGSSTIIHRSYAS